MTDEELEALQEAAKWLTLARQAIDRVRELHKPLSQPSGKLDCNHCYENSGDYYEPKYPCDTIKALTNEQ